MSDVEREIRDRAIDALGEVAGLDVRPMFSGYGFYINGLLVAAAWDGAFQLRYREGGRWVYRPVDGQALTDSDQLVDLIRQRADDLSAHQPPQRPGT